MKEIHFIKRILHHFNLDAEIDDFDTIHESITKDVIFKGKNLWILIFAIIIASVGLNMNSTAVVIGAMLISPLMGPINGMGYSIATYNFPLFRQSLRNFSFAVITSLTTSTIYFALSPISMAHSELLARTSPTIYDVIIALFGGLAGIVAISSKQKGNVIPGVAIATALMPPLCTAGYGLASGQFNYFFGAFYLFIINTVFIALSSVAISQLLKFPIKTIVGTEQKRKVNRWITLVTVLIFIPSVYLGFKLVQKEKFVGNANRYIENISFAEENYLLKHEINPTDKTITLIYGGATMTELQKNAIKEKTDEFSIGDAEIIIKQGLSFDYLKRGNTEVEKLKTELNRISILLQNKEKQIDSLTHRQQVGQEIIEEIKNLYPQIKTCSFAETYVFDGVSYDPDEIELVVFETKDNSLTKTDKKKIANWLKTKLRTENLKIYYDTKDTSIKTN